MIGLVVGDQVTLVSSAEETAQGRLPRAGADAGSGRDPDAPPPAHRFLATGDAAAVRSAWADGSSDPQIGKVTTDRRRSSL